MVSEGASQEQAPAQKRGAKQAPAQKRGAKRASHLEAGLRTDVGMEAFVCVCWQDVVRRVQNLLCSIAMCTAVAVVMM